MHAESHGPPAPAGRRSARGWLLFLLFLVATAVLGVGIAYYRLVRPIGFEKIQAQAMADVARVEAGRASRLAADPVLHAFRASRKARSSEPLATAADGNRVLAEAIAASMPPHGGEGLAGNWMAISGVQLVEHVYERTGMLASSGPERIAGLAGLPWNESDAVVHPTPARAVALKAGRPQAVRAWVDEVEEWLLGGAVGKLPGASTGTVDASVNLAAGLALRRALLEGESRRAADIFVATCEWAGRTLVPFPPPDAPGVDGGYFESLVLWTCERPDFPVERLAEAQEVLWRLRLSPEELRASERAAILAYAAHLQEQIANGPRYASPTHAALGGLIERAQNALATPIMLRRAERLTQAALAGSVAGVEVATSDLYQACQWGHSPAYGPSVAPPMIVGDIRGLVGTSEYFPRREDVTAVRALLPASCDDASSREVDFAIFMLASERFRRSVGRLSDSLNDLVPGYVPGEWADLVDPCGVYIAAGQADQAGESCTAVRADLLRCWWVFPLSESADLTRVENWSRVDGPYYGVGKVLRGDCTGVDNLLDDLVRAMAPASAPAASPRPEAP